MVGHPGADSLTLGIDLRIFATNAALTNEINEAGAARSRFGPADSWVIKIRGAAVSAAGC
jgi:hypothetical protein